MENKNNSFVVTVTPITDNLDKEIQAPQKKNLKTNKEVLKFLMNQK
nr:hypothetical protein [Bacillus cereus group sp. BfR-BA-01522]